MTTKNKERVRIHVVTRLLAWIEEGRRSVYRRSDGSEFIIARRATGGTIRLTVARDPDGVAALTLKGRPGV